MVKSITGCRPWKGEIPIKYRQKEQQTVKSAFDWKLSGNDHFSQNRFHDAILSYTNGIGAEKLSDKNKLDLLSNRCAAYLALQKYELGLADAESVLSADNTHIKCLFRKAKALFGLAKYRDALKFLNSLSQDTLPSTHKEIIVDLIVKSKLLIAQSETGDYPWVHIFQNQFDELAEFVGPVIVKHTRAKGRGLFATDVIKAGQLIMASKAFAHVTVNVSSGFFLNMRWNQNDGRKSLYSQAQTQLVTEIAHILKENPEKCREVYNLYAGPHYNNHNEPIDSHGYEIDMPKIEAICSYNQFGSSGLQINNAGEEHCGLWLAPSYINHSCVDANCNWYWKKNFLFVTAFRDIAEDEEILISYVPPLGEKAEKMLKNHNFVCDCRLCVRDLEDNAIVKAKRSELISRLDEIVNKYGDGGSDPLIRRDISDDINEITMILKSLSNLRIDAPELNLSYIDKMEIIARVYYRNFQFLNSVRTLEQMYKLIANVPPFILLTTKITNDIVGTYATLGQMEKVQEWIPVLKRNCTLAYGTSNVIEMAFPFTYDMLKTHGISL